MENFTFAELRRMNDNELTGLSQEIEEEQERRRELHFAISVINEKLKFVCENACGSDKIGIARPSGKLIVENIVDYLVADGDNGDFFLTSGR